MLPRPHRPVPAAAATASRRPPASSTARCGASTRRSRRPPTGSSGVYLLKLSARTTGRRTRSCSSCATTASHSDVAVHRPDVDVPGLQRLLREVALQRRERSAQHRLGRAARRDRVVRPAVRPARPRRRATRHDWYTRTDVATVSWLEQQGYDVSYFASRGPARERRPAAQNHEVFDLRRPTTSTGRRRCSTPPSRPATPARRCSSPAPTPSTGSVRFVAEPRHRRRQPRDGRLQDDRERPARTPAASRPPPGATRPARTGPRTSCSARCTSATTSSHDFPLRVSAAEGKHRLLALHAASPTCRRHDRDDRHRPRRLGVGLAHRQRPRAGRRADARVVARVRQPDPGQRRVPERRQRHRRRHDCLQGGQRRARLRHAAPTTGGAAWRCNVDGEGEPESRIQQATVNVLVGHGRAARDARGRPRRSIRPARPVVPTTQPGRRRRRRRSRTCP